MQRSEPGEADIEGIIDEHQARSLSLSLAFLGEDREIGAPLDPALLVPRALPVPHQHHPLCPLHRWEWHRRVELGAQLPLLGGLGCLLQARASRRASDPEGAGATARVHPCRVWDREEEDDGRACAVDERGSGSE